MSDESRGGAYKDGAAPVPLDKDLTVPPKDRDEFVRAVLAFRDRHKRVPTPVEGFRIALTLGWRKQ